MRQQSALRAASVARHAGNSSVGGTTPKDPSACAMTMHAESTSIVADARLRPGGSPIFAWDPTAPPIKTTSATAPTHVTSGITRPAMRKAAAQSLQNMMIFQKYGG